MQAVDTHMIRGYTIAVYGVPGQWRSDGGPDKFGFFNAVETALETEKRIESKTFTSDDLHRYDRVTRTIERYASENGVLQGDIPLSVMDALIAQYACLDNRIGRSFIPPWMIDRFSVAIESVRSPIIEQLKALSTALSQEGWGVVFVVESRLVPRDEYKHTTEDQKRNSAAFVQPAIANALAQNMNTCPDCFSSDKRRQNAIDALRKETTIALRSGLPVSVGASARHEVLTEMLRELHGLGAEGLLRILYVDGSESEPFRFYPLLQAANEQSICDQPLRFGLMSMRHTELDDVVAGYIFRNRMVSLQRTLAETEKECVLLAHDFLSELLSNGVRGIEVVNTGFEPAVIGFYRAVSIWNAGCGESERIVVQPLYKTWQGYIYGSVWD